MSFFGLREINPWFLVCCNESSNVKVNNKLLMSNEDRLILIILLNCKWESKMPMGIT